MAAATLVVIRLTGPPSPRSIADPTELLLAPKDFGDSWAVSAEADSMTGDMFGLDDDWPEFATGFATCLGMDGGTIEEWRASGVYVTNDAAAVPESAYGMAQSVGFLTDSETEAARLVDVWRSPNFDGCLDAATSDAFYYVGDEEEDYEKNPQFSEPSLPEDVPESVNAAIRRIEIPLSTDAAGDTTDSSQFVDVVAVSAGTSAVYLLLRTSSTPPPESLRESAIQALVDRLVE